MFIPFNPVTGEPIGDIYVDRAIHHEDGFSGSSKSLGTDTSDIAGAPRILDCEK